MFMIHASAGPAAALSTTGRRALAHCVTPHIVRARAGAVRAARLLSGGSCQGEARAIRCEVLRKKLFGESTRGSVRSQTNQQQCGRAPRRDQVRSPWRLHWWRPERTILFLMRAFLKNQSKPSSVGSARHSSSSPSLNCGWCQYQNLSLDVLLLKTSLEPLFFGSTEREFTVLIAI